MPSWEVKIFAEGLVSLLLFSFLNRTVRFKPLGIKLQANDTAVVEMSLFYVLREREEREMRH